jgi:hypothetical protein
VKEAEIIFSLVRNVCQRKRIFGKRFCRFLYFVFLVSRLVSGLYRGLHDSQISADFENNFEKPQIWDIILI